MATPKVYVKLTGAWTDVIGSAANVAGVTWQNLPGGAPVSLAFTTTAPAGGSSDAYHVLAPGEAYYDKNGSAHCWACAAGTTYLSATAD